MSSFITMYVVNTKYQRMILEAGVSANIVLAAFLFQVNQIYAPRRRVRKSKPPMKSFEGPGMSGTWKTERNRNVEKNILYTIIQSNTLSFTDVRCGELSMLKLINNKPRQGIP